MDTAFELGEEGRANFLQILVQSTGCSYVCLWSCSPLTSCLCSIDGIYQEAAGNNSMQPGSPAGTLAWRLFDEYRKSLFIIDINRGSLPGFAFRNNHPCIEVKEDDLLRLATNHAQRQFYREARIKKAVFMGCRSGEIELGYSDTSPADNAETLLRGLFPEDFSRQVAVPELPRDIEQQINPPSSSSSSFRSFSLDSPEYSSLLFNFHEGSFIPDPLKEIATATTAAIDPSQQTLTTPAITVPQALQALARISNLQFPIPRNEHDALTKAFIAVISSPSSSTSSPRQQQNLPGEGNLANPSDSAFRRYAPALHRAGQVKPVARRHSMTKRAIVYLRNLDLVRIRQRLQAAGTCHRPTSTQLHHMMAERRRREKLKESLQALKALLPPGTKRDKASILASTREYLTSLQAQIEELRQRNAALEAQLLPSREAAEEPAGDAVDGNPIDIQVRQTTESTSQDRTVDLQVIIRRECSSTAQLVIRILEFLGQLSHVRLMSMDADANAAETRAVARVNMRLRIEGNEWDESAFREAVRRVVSDAAQWQSKS